MNIIASFVISALITLGGVYYQVKHPVIWDNAPINFGSTNFPTSLDSLTNPGATDSVATVSHSAQHSNANDAIEALEAKMGIGASTPVADSIFGGLSTGVSGWFTWATSTRFTATNFLATGSTTLQSFTFHIATGTSATTTSFFTTTSSSTNSFVGSGLSIGTISGAGLTADCLTSSFLQYTLSTGKFSCGTTSSAGITTVSTTSLADMATTTLKGIPYGKHLHITALVASSSNQALRICFNEDWGGCKQTTGYYGYGNSVEGGAMTVGTDATFINLDIGGAGTVSVKRYIELDIFNTATGTPKGGSGQSFTATSTGTLNSISEHDFYWGTTTASINSISIVTPSPTLLLGAGTIINAQVTD